MLRIAKTLSFRGTCVKLAVGCVLADLSGRIIGTGYNGVARGQPHCYGEQACPGAGQGKGSDTCEAIHAEQNALLQCRDVDKIDVAYVTHAPCLRCAKTLLNTTCGHIIFLSDEFTEPAARELWERSGRIWQHYKEEV